MVTSTEPAPTPAAVRPFHIRPLRSGDGLEIRRIFRATIVLGRPLALEYADLVSYERLCLDWYLTHGRADARVVEQDGEVVGYLLACLDQPAYDEWIRRRAVRWAGRATYRLATARLRGDALRFAKLRAQDGLSAWQGAPPPPFPAHAHLNLSAHVRDGGVGHRLVAVMDDLVEAAGFPGWYGEINVPEGGSLRALERQGARIVHRMPNRTFTWALGTPVDRVTVARSLTERSQRLSTATG